VARNKLRAGLTILGILIGVAAVVITTALGAGARGQIDEQIEKLGSNTLLVFPQANQASGARGAQGSGGRLTEDDAKALVRGSTSIAAAAPYLRSFAQVVYEDRNVATQILGTTRDYLVVRNWAVSKGEAWSEAAETSGERVAVLGSSTSEGLFGSLDPIGRVIRIGLYPYRVIGLLETKGQSPFGNDQDDVILLTAASFRSHVMPVSRKGVHGILLSATSAETNDRAKAQAEAILRQRHKIDGARDPDFVIRTQAEFRASQDAIYGALSTLLLLVGAVSLLVGGLGIMNIMLVSVAERTREIGIRMAIGAREADILLQFLVEAIVLALLGGILGTLTAAGVIFLAERLAMWPMRLEPRALLIALSTSSAIGVVFGLFPARKAARLDPIVALGRE
jgi:putative ABC transport system permease protein